MKKRDMAILNDLQRFRCLTRDHIIELHFRNLKNAITCCNTVMKRLRRDGYIEVNTNHQPYLYYPAPSSIKKDSTKIPHFLRIADFYISLLKYEEPKMFICEPKYSKKGEYMEPDGFMLWKRAPFFVEIQRSVYSAKVMAEKVARYEAYFLSNEWQNEAWQPANKKIFPTIILVTDTRYSIDSAYVKFLQVQNIDQVVAMFSEPTPQPIKSTGIKYEIKKTP